jgi:hypothetical protein
VVLNLPSVLKNKSFIKPKASRSPANASLAAMLPSRAVAVAAVMVGTVAAVAVMVVPNDSFMMRFVPLAVFKPRFPSNPTVPSLSIVESVTKTPPPTRRFGSWLKITKSAKKRFGIKSMRENIARRLLVGKGVGLRLNTLKA